MTNEQLKGLISKAARWRSLLAVLHLKRTLK